MEQSQHPSETPFRYAHAEIRTEEVVICDPPRYQLYHGGSLCIEYICSVSCSRSFLQYTAFWLDFRFCIMYDCLAVVVVLCILYNRLAVFVVLCIIYGWLSMVVVIIYIMHDCLAVFFCVFMYNI